MEYGKKFCKDSPTIEEDRLQTAIIQAISILVKDKDELISTLKSGLKFALDGADEGIDAYDIERRINELNAVMLDLVQVSAKSDAGADYFDVQFKQISDEIKALQEQLHAHEQQQTCAKSTTSRLEEVFETLENTNLNLTEYDEQLVRQLIDRVNVVSAEKIVIAFKGGFEIEQVL